MSTPQQFLITTTVNPPGTGTISPATAWYGPYQSIPVTATPSTGYVFTGFTGALTGTTNPQNLWVSGNASLTANFADPYGTRAVTATPQIATFSVNGTQCSSGTCLFTPTGSDTVTVLQTISPTQVGSAPVPMLEYWSPDGSIQPQAVTAPPIGSAGVGNCPWTCSNGLCTATISTIPVTGSPRPSPVIQAPKSGTYAVSSDAAGQYPAILVPGQQSTIYVHGINFGNVAGVASFCTPGGSPCTFYANLSITENIQSWTDTLIEDVVAMDPNSPPGLWDIFLNVPFWVAAGYWLNPSMGTVEVEPGMPPTLVVTASTPSSPTNPCGNAPTQITSTVGTIYISGDNPPVMPCISVSLSGGYTAQDTAAYQFVITFAHRNVVNNQLVITQDVWAYPYGPPALPGPPASQGQTWGPPALQTAGSVATIYWWYDSVSQAPFQFTILGINPTPSTALAMLTSPQWWPNPWWMLPAIATAETNMSQFCQAPQTNGDGYCAGGLYPGMPLWGSPGGYGILQLDPTPANSPVIWDWTQAVSQGVGELSNKAAVAYPFWQSQVTQWQTYNTLHPQTQVAAPTDQTEGQYCTFTMAATPTEPTAPTFSPNPAWFGDATLIKQYNGTWFAGTYNGVTYRPASYNYIAWNSSVFPNRWNVLPVSIIQGPNGPIQIDYVQNVCNACQTPGTCQ